MTRVLACFFFEQDASFRRSGLISSFTHHMPSHRYTITDTLCSYQRGVIVHHMGHQARVRAWGECVCMLLTHAWVILICTCTLCTRGYDH